MKLYEVPNNTKIRVIRDVKVPPCAPQINDGDLLNFHHIDGVYSYCTNADKEVVHLVAWAEVEVIE